MLAAMLLALLAGCGGRGDEAAIAVPFNPSLGRPIYYRYDVVQQGATGTRRRASAFRIQFERDAHGTAMVLTSVRRDLSPWPADRHPAPLVERRFLLGASGQLRALANEPAYWSALEQAMSRDGGAEARTAIQAERESRRLPDRERMLHVAGDASEVTFFAGTSYSRQPTERPAGKASIHGPIEFMRQTSVARLSEDRVTLLQTLEMPRERLQAMADTLRGRYGGSPDIGSRLVSMSWRVTVELDRHTGLLVSRRTIQDIASVEGGRTLRFVTTTRLQRVPAPSRDRRTPPRPQ
ncbi:MAG TPA: hypothetical protein VMG08_11925 [Allosphingosinicella sp.]|nr:hypothetical protein [Allosphingosinicella sp.]